MQIEGVMTEGLTVREEIEELVQWVVHRAGPALPDQLGIAVWCQPKEMTDDDRAQLFAFLKDRFGAVSGGSTEFFLPSIVQCVHRF